MTLEEIKEKGLNDPYFFIKNILGYSKMAKVPHLDLLNFVTNSKKRTSLILMPRGSFKSSVVTVGYTLYSILRNPNIRVLIAGETQKNAIKFVSEIKAHLDQNPKFNTLYGNLEGTKWKENEFIVNTRTVVKKEPTVMASSLEKGTIVGLHFDVIVLDDVVSINNINSPEQIQKTIDYYKLLLSILEPDGKIFVVGTRWSYYELYSWIMDPSGTELKNADWIIREAEDDNGTLLMPDVLTREFLDMQRNTQGEWIYNCQYLNKAISSDICTFRTRDVRFYQTIKNHTVNFMTFDPAVSGIGRSDYSALVVVGVDFNNKWYVLEALQLKLSMTEVIDMIFNLVKKYDVVTFAMEKFALEKLYKEKLIQEMEERKFHFPLKDLPTNSKLSKEARIRGLCPYFERHQILIHESQKDLYQQIVAHPQLKHDDLLDALKLMIPIVYPSDIPPVDESIVQRPPLTENEKRAWADLKQFDKKVKRKYEEDY